MERICEGCQTPVPEGRSACPSCGRLQRNAPAEAPATTGGPRFAGAAAAPPPTVAPTGAPMPPGPSGPPHRPAGPPGVLGYDAPPPRTSTARRRSQARSAQLGCLLAPLGFALVVALIVFVAVKLTEADPDELNVDDRSEQTGQGYRFTMDGEPDVVFADTSSGSGPFGPGLGSSWRSAQGSWSEVVTLIRTSEPIADVDGSIDRLRGLLEEGIQTDVELESDEQVDGARTWTFTAEADARMRDPDVGRDGTTGPHYEIRVVLLDPQTVATLVVGYDPDRPPHPDELDTLQASFEPA